MPRASSLAAEIKKELGVESQLVRGGGGIFDVSVDSKRIFSKKEEGRFPSEKEIIDQLRAITSS
ncbi:MAG: selenoprotein [Acidobacteria bacterium]|nr:MAG: selenoprotein [Acidobacteriota bacterium]